MVFILQITVGVEILRGIGGAPGVPGKIETFVLLTDTSLRNIFNNRPFTRPGHGVQN